jgi:hypothetical protein
VSVLLNNGDGSFQPPVAYAVGVHPDSIAVGDFRGNGILDLVVTYAGGIAMLQGNGDGTFQPAMTIDTVSFASSLVAADLNNDGRLDLAVQAGGTIRIYLGNGDGTFQTPSSYAVFTDRLAVGDFNNDGVPDLALVGTFGVRVLTGNGDGTFRSSNVSYGPPDIFAAVGDVNADGFPDLVASNYGGTVTVLLNAADWGAGNQAVPPKPFHPLSIRRLIAKGPWIPFPGTDSPATSKFSANSFQPARSCLPTHCKKDS